jgi:hypothetical protein
VVRVAIFGKVVGERGALEALVIARTYAHATFAFNQIQFGARQFEKSLSLSLSLSTANRVATEYGSCRPRRAAAYPTGDVARPYLGPRCTAARVACSSVAHERYATPASYRFYRHTRTPRSRWCSGHQQRRGNGPVAWR